VNTDSNGLEQIVLLGEAVGVSDVTVTGSGTAASPSVITVEEYLARFASIELQARAVEYIEARVSWVELRAEETVIDEKVSIYIVD
jgi:hypothetical protein